MLQSDKTVIHKVQHGNVDIPLVIVPINEEVTVVVAFLIDSDCIMLLEAVY